jgi:hypothetical protein
MLDLKVVYASMDSLERMCMSPDQEPDFPLQVMRSERLAGSCRGESASALAGTPWEGSRSLSGACGNHPCLKAQVVLSGKTGAILLHRS